jgi:hypothetical protein
LRVGIARGRPHASVLVIPRRKTRLCEALHGRAAVAGVRASWDDHGELAGEERGRGRGERRGGTAWGRHGEREGCRGCSLAATAARLLSAVREKEEGRKREEKKRREKKRGKKEKNMENFPNLKICREKNKRQFMKLVKKFVLYKKGINLIIIT